MRNTKTVVIEMQNVANDFNEKYERSNEFLRRNKLRLKSAKYFKTTS